MATDKPLPASRSALLLGQWCRGIAELTPMVRRDGFAAALLQAVRRLVDFDFVMIFGYWPAGRPMGLGDTLEPKRRRVIVDDYLNGPYMLDPFFQAVLAGHRSGCHRLHSLAPDRFRQGEYYRAHYRRTDIGEEVGFFFELPGGGVGVASLARWMGSPRLSRQDQALLLAVEPAVGALCTQNWFEADPRPRAATDKSRRLNGRTNGDLGVHHSPSVSLAYQKFGEDLLSERERQVATLVLQGHSSESIAGRLDISPGTVKIHRRNCYRKLGIATQAELFAAFLAHLS